MLRHSGRDLSLTQTRFSRHIRLLSAVSVRTHTHTHTHTHTDTHTHTPTHSHSRAPILSQTHFLISQFSHKTIIPKTFTNNIHSPPPRTRTHTHTHTHTHHHTHTHTPIYIQRAS